MKPTFPAERILSFAFIVCLSLSALGQTPGNPPGRDGGPGPSGPQGGRGGPGGAQQEVKLVKQFDKDGDKRLNAVERKAAREFLAREKAEGRGPRGPGGRGRGGNQEAPKPGPKLSPTDVKSYPNAPLYDPETLRTVFLEFENADWEKELADFYHTDVEVPAKLTVDGKTYPEVGIHFRGASSYFTVREGLKHSLSISMDFAKKDQRLGGYRTLNLLNSHEDPTYLRAVLYYQISRDYIPAPKANFMRVVINGESWGVYPNVQHFDKDLINDGFKTTKGARWKVPGSPRAQGGLGYLGEDPALYKRSYEIKSKDEPKAWVDLIRLCRVLNQTPSEKLEAALAPLLDIDGALKFLALENVFINNDGYWIRTSDYSIYQDEKGRFHVIPHDANETFAVPGGPGFGGAGKMDTPKLDPLFGADDPRKPLLNKLLAVPALKARYLGYVHDMAERWLDWNTLGPLAEKYQALIAADLKTDTRKLDSFESFRQGATVDVEGAGMRGPQQSIGLKNFADQRRAFLLDHPEVSKAPVAAGAKSK